MLNPKNLNSGSEQYEEYIDTVRKFHKDGGNINRRLIQYDYRHTNGKLFSCIGKNLEDCRFKRDRWLNS